MGQKNTGGPAHRARALGALGGALPALGARRCRPVGGLRLRASGRAGPHPAPSPIPCTPQPARTAAATLPCPTSARSLSATCRRPTTQTCCARCSTPWQRPQAASERPPRAARHASPRPPRGAPAATALRAPAAAGSSWPAGTPVRARPLGAGSTPRRSPKPHTTSKHVRTRPRVVHTAVITEPGSGVSRGFGFVHIPDPIAAKAARDALDGHVVGGLPRSARAAALTFKCCGVTCGLHAPHTRTLHPWLAHTPPPVAADARPLMDTSSCGAVARLHHSEPPFPRPIPSTTHRDTHTKQRWHNATHAPYPPQTQPPKVDASGRGIVVRLRTERGQRSEPPPSGGHVGGPGLGLHHRPGPGEIDETKLYVAGLTAHATEEPIRGLFGRCARACVCRGERRPLQAHARACARTHLARGEVLRIVTLRLCDGAHTQTHNTHNTH